MIHCPLAVFMSEPFWGFVVSEVFPVIVENAREKKSRKTRGWRFNKRIASNITAPVNAINPNTPFRDFLKEIVSRRALPFYKIGDLVSRYPDTPRIK